jgi:non-specific serine/threonine protein kinase/serine/threonine-protein kinase
MPPGSEDPAVRQEAKRIFALVLEHEPANRLEYLRELCGPRLEIFQEVSSLLEVDAGLDSFLERPPLGPVPAGLAARVDPLIGRMIGPYRVIREIGRGGMGFVYLAQRADDQFRRQVALKVVNPELVDRHTLNRFENERQTLAALDHPNIIKLLDGGATENGMPWLAMDYMEGQSIDLYCETHWLAVAERISLFRTVCGAVHYAHQNLVIHRDLKPGNILITPQGVPKLLDFGIAKLLRPEFAMRTVGQTLTNLQPMTPEFASPEQIRGLPLTTTSDVYSLGVLLYRLVVGRHPYNTKSTSLLELERAICETDPEKPSTAIRAQRRAEPATAPSRDLGLSNDLDVIILMAMRKEPQRRYASAEHLSEDLQLLLEGRPVSARKDTLGYRVSKLVSRHKAGTAVAALAIMALLIMGLFAYREYLQAKRRAQELHQFAQVVLNIDEGLQSGRVETRAAMLGKAVESLDNLARDGGGNPELERDLVRAYVNMADVQGNLYSANLGNTAGAEGLYRKALAIAETLQRADPNSSAANLDVALCNRKLADVLLAKGDRLGALEKYKGALPMIEAVISANPTNQEALRGLVNIWGNIGNTYDELGDPAGAMEGYQKSGDAARKWVLLDPSRRISVAFAMEKVAYYGMLSGKGTDGEQTIQEALDIFTQTAEANPSPTARRNLADAYDKLALVQKSSGKVTAALASAQKSRSILEGLLASDPKNQQYEIDVPEALRLEIELDLLAGEMASARRQTERALHLLTPLVNSPAAAEDSLFGYAYILIHTPFPQYQNPAAALDSATRATELSHESDPEILEVLALAQAKIGKRTQSIESLQKALALLQAPKPGDPIPELRKRLERDLASLRQ